jgi:hypothetical protein
MDRPNGRDEVSVDERDRRDRRGPRARTDAAARTGPEPRAEFFRLLPLRLDALTWALDEHDHAELARAACDLRLAAETLAAEALVELCHRFEARARDGLLHDGPALAAELTRACDVLAAQLTVSAR